MPGFGHERLDAYQAAIEFVAVANAIGEKLPGGRGYLADQLQRATVSIPLNIAEGAGEFSRREKARFHRMGRRSAMERAAILDVVRVLRLVDGSSLQAGRDLLDRIGAMLTRMAQVLENPGVGPGGPDR